MDALSSDASQTFRRGRRGAERSGGRAVTDRDRTIPVADGIGKDAVGESAAPSHVGRRPGLPEPAAATTRFSPASPAHEAAGRTGVTPGSWSEPALKAGYDRSPHPVRSTVE